MKVTALKTFNGREGLIRAGLTFEVEEQRAKDLERVGLVSRHVVKPAEPETKNEGGSKKAPTVAELKAQAKELGIEGADDMKKAQLEEAIAKASKSPTLDELKARAAELGIEGAEEMDEAALAEAIASAEQKPEQE